jgi:type I restriction enzyme S subunit
MNIVRLGDYVEVDSGYAFKSKLFNDNEGIPIIRIRDVNSGFSKTYYSGEYSEKYIVINGDLLITMDGEFYIREWYGGKALLNQRVCRIRSNTKKLNERFLLYLLPKVLKDIEDKTPFVTVKHLSVKDILDSQVYIPDATIQKNIVEILDIATDLIQKRKEQITALSSLTQSAFIQLLEGNSKHEIKLKELIVDTKNGISRRGSDTNGSIVLRLREVKENSIDYSDINRILLNEKEQINYTLNQDDILLVRVNGNPDYVGRCAIFNLVNEEIYFNDHIIRIRTTNEVNPTYLSYFLNSRYGKKEIKRYIKTSAGQYTISRDGIEQITILLPSIEPQREFANLYNKINKEKIKLQKSLVYFEELFNSLQQLAFKGKLFKNQSNLFNMNK